MVKYNDKSFINLKINMKKIISLASLLSIVLVSVISIVFLPTKSEAQNIGSLRNVVTSGFSFKKDLRLGDTDSDVRELQRVLNADVDTMVATEGPGSHGKESTYFGELTKVAVIKFQNKYKDIVLTLNSITTADGVVNRPTRTRLNLLIGVMNTYDSVGVPQGQTVTIIPAPIVVSTPILTPTNSQPNMSTCQFVELLINIGAISSNNASRARSAVNCSSDGSPYVDLKVNNQSNTVTVLKNSNVAVSWRAGGVISCSGRANNESLTGNVYASNNNTSSGNVNYTVGTVNQTLTVTCRTVNGNNISDSVSVRVSDTVIVVATTTPAVATTTSASAITGSNPWSLLRLSSVKKNVISAIGTTEVVGSKPTWAPTWPSIATDSKDQPHILVSGVNNYGGLYYYEKIVGVWHSLIPLVIKEGGPTLAHIGINDNDKTWISGSTVVFGPGEETPSGGNVAPVADLSLVPIIGIVHDVEYEYCEPTGKWNINVYLINEFGLRKEGLETVNYDTGGNMFYTSLHHERYQHFVIETTQDKNYTGLVPGYLLSDTQIVPYLSSSSIDPNQAIQNSSTGAMPTTGMVNSTRVPNKYDGVFGYATYNSIIGENCGHEGYIGTVQAMGSGALKGNLKDNLTTLNNSASVIPEGATLCSVPTGQALGPVPVYPLCTSTSIERNGKNYNVSSAGVNTTGTSAGTAGSTSGAGAVSSSGHTQEEAEALTSNWLGYLGQVTNGSSLSWFNKVIPTSKFNFCGVLAVDPFYSDNAWFYGCQPDPMVKVDSRGSQSLGKTMSPGASGEKIAFKIAPNYGTTTASTSTMVAKAGVWHAAMGGVPASGSWYVNSTMSKPVLWADGGKYNTMGDDGQYVSVGVDWKNSKVAYLGSSYGGVAINIWDGTKMIFPTNKLQVVDSNPADYGNGITRFAPQWTPAQGGGAFLCWTGSDGYIKMKYITTEGVSKFGATKNIVKGQQCVMSTDTKGNIDMAFLSGGNVKYVKITTGVASSTTQ